jgi:hypothetical protein
MFSDMFTNLNHHQSHMQSRRNNMSRQRSQMPAKKSAAG